ncbi:MAG: hypothetical protein UT30_C0021G0014 [Candidatus Uhrbacteria bacterium GW2011_GWF2_39_13]|uniref:Uncharacterized protein n=1 Tax=Candidatus Uhrbacteria bacterium GW2011_GWF2_39_13 TaxID=1618995 RepID=A0A0G0PZZ7_9BACT|nr:MAG: hypothetical protein UT30_C0021G0014 [Candidatus Uhrbacteria bacterium GW2011_GWF2_39_13]
MCKIGKNYAVRKKRKIFTETQSQNLKSLLSKKAFLKTVAFCLMAFFATRALLAEQEQAATFTFISVNAAPDIVKSGEDFVVTAKFNTAPEEEAAGYSFYTYAAASPNAVSANFKDMGWVLYKPKSQPDNLKWRSYIIVPNKGFKRRTGQDLTVTHTISTKNWPVGDYRLNVKIVTFINGKDFYRTTNFLVSVVE